MTNYFILLIKNHYILIIVLIKDLKVNQNLSGNDQKSRDKGYKYIKNKCFRNAVFTYFIWYNKLIFICYVYCYYQYVKTELFAMADSMYFFKFLRELVKSKLILTHTWTRREKWCQKGNMSSTWTRREKSGVRRVIWTRREKSGVRRVICPLALSVAFLPFI
jgi:hypothetical protein